MKLLYEKLGRAKAAWNLAGKYAFKGLKRAFLDPEIRARIGEGVALNPGALLKLVGPSQWAGARNFAGMVEELGKLDLRFIVRTYTSFPDDVLRFRIDVVKPGSLKTWQANRAVDPLLEIPTWRAPRVSAALERATGIEWRFGEGTLEPENLKRIYRAAQHAMKNTEVAEAVKRAVPKSNPFEVKAHVPFQMPDLRFGVSFRQGRAQGWLHVAKEITNLASIASFAQFIKGQNPGFIAQVLFTNPIVGMLGGFAINAIVGHFRRRKAKRRAAAAAAAAFEEAKKIGADIEYLAKRYRILRRAPYLKSSDLARTVATMRYSL